ncbi:MAG: Integral rane protein [Gammaproteobacteria bacterium]|jgi:uncharacterized membrane protein|nr:Integral rane protein [Gammaproteobacteria bacterium]
MTLYLWLKFIHVVSSTILFGTGIGTACNMLLAHRSKDVHIIATTARYVVAADWVFTGTTGFLQPVTGLWMVYLAGYPLTATWVLGSTVGYLIAALCWFPVVYLQIKMRDCAVEADKNNTPLPEKYYRYFTYWFWLGWPAFISLIIVFYLMTNK